MLHHCRLSPLGSLPSALLTFPLAAVVISYLAVSVSAGWPRPASDYLRPRQYTALSDDLLPAIANISNMGPISDSILNYHDPKSALAKLLVPRAPESANLVALQKMIKSHFQALSTAMPVQGQGQTQQDGEEILKTWHLQEDTFIADTPYGPKSMTNLIFTHDPLAEKRFVLAAHIDSKYFPTAPMNGFVGATDSAVPCGIMLDVASALNDHLNRLVERWQGASVGGMPDGVRTTVQLVFLDGEEAFKTWTSTDSIYGARHLADLWDKPVGPPSPTSPQRNTIQSIDVFVLLDLIGVANPTIRNFYLETGWLFDSLVHAEARLGARGLLWRELEGEQWDVTALSGGQTTRSFFEARHSDYQIYTGRIEDDHIPFLARGVPILHLIPVPFPTVWHTLRDDASAIDLPTIQAWSLIMRVVVAEYLDLFDDNSDDLRPRDELKGVE